MIELSKSLPNLVKHFFKNPKYLPEIDTIASQQFKIGDLKQLQGWMISLYELTSDVPSHEDLIITAGDSLIAILGKELYARLKEVKISFLE